MKLIDTHCDTALEILRRGESIVENTRHISLNKAKGYENYAQFFALWACNDRSDEDSYQEFLRMNDNMMKEIEEHSDKLAYVNTFSEMKSAWDAGSGHIMELGEVGAAIPRAAQSGQLLEFPVVVLV